MCGGGRLELGIEGLRVSSGVSISGSGIVFGAIQAVGILMDIGHWWWMYMCVV